MNKLHLNNVKRVDGVYTLYFDCFEMESSDHLLLINDRRLKYITTRITPNRMCMWSTTDEAAVIEYSLRFGS